MARRVNKHRESTPNRRHPPRRAPAPQVIDAVIGSGLGASADAAGLLARATSGHYRCDRDFRFTYANPALARMHGFDSVEAFLAKRSFHDCVRDKDAAARFVDDLFDHGTLHGITQTRVRDDGRTFESWETAHCVVDDKGRRVAIEGMVVDISAQTFLDDKLRQSERALVNKIEELQSTLDAMEQGVCVYDRENHLVTWNKPFHDLIDTLGNVSVGMPLKRQIDHLAVMGVLGPGDPSKLAQAELRRISNDAYDPIEIQRAHDGRVFEIRRHRLEDGGHMVTYTDVTERDRTRDALQAAREIAEIANRSKTNYIAFLGHEFRTPLNTVLAFAEMLTDETFSNDTERVRTYAGYIYQSGEMLMALLNDVLDLSRLEAGEAELSIEPVDAHSLFDDLRRLIGLEFEKRGIAFSVAIPDPCPTFRADKRSVKQVILNLLTNAAKHTPSGGSVSASVRPETNGEFVISVQDTGQGIKAEAIPGLLNPFSRTAEDLKVSSVGSGLGLPICKYLMDMHGGRMEVDSIVDQGTTVSLYFPKRSGGGKS